MPVVDRRRGVHRGAGRQRGHALLRAAEEWAREHGYRELASDTELHNEASERAHRAFGFDEAERGIHFRMSL